MSRWAVWLAILLLQVRYPDVVSAGSRIASSGKEVGIFVRQSEKTNRYVEITDEKMEISDMIVGMMRKWAGQEPPAGNGRTCHWQLLPYAMANDRRTGYDPSWRLYEGYRYAYETYGYLFSDGQNGEEDGAAARLVSGGSSAGNASALTASGGLPLESEQASGSVSPGEAARLTPDGLPTMAQLMDYDYLMKRYYSVHTSTTAGRDLMKAEKLLGTDLSLDQDPSVPQILIYHTHSQETYADYGPGMRQATVVRVGEYLAQLLRAKGWNVIHDTTAYDIAGGGLDRSKAYTYALDGVTKILEENPQIEVVLDIHRDGVAETTRLVSEINGKSTAKIMFFQGMSRTPDGPIESLANPYLEENLAFGFQMQLAAEADFPGLTRKIYLKGLRYNMHVRPRCALIEVGAQTNTLEEAMNAMEPLSGLLDGVLRRP
ncbi:MAG: stage II sporulation protein P [Clostridiales bacterium]|nr:stage II sporulation protein P [Clostridiales bacterium]